MLYSIDENRDSYYDILDYLDEQVYLTEEESLISPYQIPIISLNEQNFVHFDYIKQLSSDESSIESILDTLTETHNLDNLSIALPEYELLVNPFLIESNINFELLPISEDSIAYQFCEACIDAFAESGDESWLDLLLEGPINDIFINANKAREEIQNARAGGNSNQEYENDIREKYTRANAQVVSQGMKDAIKANVAKQNTPPTQPTPKQDPEKSAPKASFFQKGIKTIRNAPKHVQVKYQRLGRDVSQGWEKEGVSGVGKALWKNKGTVAATAAVGGAAGLALKKFVDYRKRVAWEAKNKPRTWLAKKIASLRSIYQKYLARARAARDKGQASIFQKVASTILGIIDALMRRLQNAVNSKV